MPALQMMTPSAAPCLYCSSAAAAAAAVALSPQFAGSQPCWASFLFLQSVLSLSWLYWLVHQPPEGHLGGSCSTSFTPSCGCPWCLACEGLSG